MAEIDPELLEIFREETLERLAHVSALIDELRRGLEPLPTIDEINRELHTIKGSVKMVGFPDLGTLVHEIEPLTGRILGPQAVLDHPLIDLIEEAADAVVRLVEDAVETGEDTTDKELLRRLKHRPQRADFPMPQELISPPPQTAAPRDSEERPLPASLPSSEVLSSPEIEWSKPDAGSSSGPRSAVVPVEGGLGWGDSTTTTSRPVNRQRRTSRRKRGQDEDWVRIRALKLRELDGLISDLIDSRLRLDHHERKLKDLLKTIEPESEAAQEAKDLYQEFRDDRQHLDLIVKDLEQLGIDLRLRPLKRVFDRIAIAGRDLARSFGKRVRIHITGENTELDRVILEGIRGPLGHIMRNVIDHGIELPEERARAGKTENGRIELSAFQDGVSVVIRVADDGAGVDTERLKVKVLERAMLSQEQVDQLSHNEVVDLVFIPGLSTREKATETSGRGVGMDVVRRNVEGLKGEVHIDSTRGVGTAIELRVPLTLLVSRVLLVRIGADRIFALPTEALDSTESIYGLSLLEYGGMSVFRLRERFIPFASLASLLGLPTNGAPRELRRVAVIRHKEDFVALEIDEFVGERSVVIKPLGWPLVNTPAISGATILGSNDIALMLHVPELLERFRKESPRLKTKRMNLHFTRLGTPRKNAVLVVDDSKVYRGIARGTLQALGYEVWAANDGEEAWDLLQHKRPDLILTDLEMPRLDGHQLLGRLKRSRDLSDIPVIIVSTRSSPEDRHQGFEAGAVEFVAKSEWSDARIDELLRRHLP